VKKFGSKLWLAAACVLAMAPVLAAQQSPGADAPAKKFYEDLVRTPIIPQRSAGNIQDDLKTAEKNTHEVDKAIADTQARIKESEVWLATNKSETDGLKAKLNVAKKEKREADKITLEGQLKQLDLVDEYLKKTREIRGAELDLAKSQKELVGAQIKVYQGELDLNKKTDAIKNAGPAAANLSKTVLDAAQAGENTLKLMKTMTDKNEDVVGQMKRLADRRIDLVQARNKLLSEDRIRSIAAGMKK
jgi:hypothetical protein